MPIDLIARKCENAKRTVMKITKQNKITFTRNNVHSWTFLTVVRTIERVSKRGGVFRKPIQFDRQLRYEDEERPQTVFQTDWVNNRVSGNHGVSVNQHSCVGTGMSAKTVLSKPVV